VHEARRVLRIDEEDGMPMKADLKAVFAYLKSLKPMQNQVPQPSPPK